MSKLILLNSFFFHLFFSSNAFCQTFNATAISNLCSELKESSGLCFANNEFYTINDSGNSPTIYVIDTANGCWSRKIHVLNATNIDWESIITDDDFLYIGDFGNNNGNRTNLRIFKILLDSVAIRDTVNCEQIEFNYAQQTDFTSLPNNNSYDCEAFISEGDSLYLFSKNWTTNNSQIYSVSKIPGSYSVNNLYTITTTGKITDAYYDGSELKLIGYTNLPFCQFYNQLSTIHQISNTTALNYTINIVGSPQMEAISLVNNEIYFTSEELIYSTLTFPSTFGKLNLEVTNTVELVSDLTYFVSENQLTFSSEKRIIQIEVYNLMGQKSSVFSPKAFDFSCPITLNTGIIVFTLEDAEIIRKRF